jgi:hypothetical protein
MSDRLFLTDSSTGKMNVTWEKVEEDMNKTVWIEVATNRD